MMSTSTSTSAAAAAVAAAAGRQGADGVVAFLNLCTRLKTTKRTGWVEHGIRGPESIADHMHRMGVMAMLILDPALDRSRCVKMAIVHDLAESIVGDLTPHSGVSKEEKYRLEKEGIATLTANLTSTPAAAREIAELWEEYEAAETPEALLVKDLDKFEMIVQAFEYEQADGTRLDSFFKATEGKFVNPQVREWAAALYERRRELHASWPPATA